MDRRSRSARLRPIVISARLDLSWALSPSKLLDATASGGNPQDRAASLFSWCANFISFRGHETSALVESGKTEGGVVFEQTGVVSYEGRELHCRRIVVQLEQPTRDGETQISLLTNLPETDAHSRVSGPIVSKTLEGRNFVSGGNREFSL